LPGGGGEIGKDLEAGFERAGQIGKELRICALEKLGVMMVGSSRAAREEHQEAGGAAGSWG